MNRLVLFLIIFILFGFFVETKANDFKHHVIILIDRSGSMDGGSKDDNINKINGFNEIVTNDLDYYCFIKEYDKGRKLLQQGDYLSIVSFAMPKNSPDFKKNFIHDIEINSNTKYIYSTSFNQGMFNNDKIIANAKRHYDISEKFFSMFWSGISFSIPMSLNYLSNQDPKMLVNKTFIIIVTDEDYCGVGNPIDELNQMLASAKEHYNEIKNSTYATSIAQKIQANFSWSEPIISIKKGGEKSKDTIKMKIFEIKPNTKTFTLAHVLQFNNNNVEFKRILNGYQSAFIISPINNNDYDITRLEVKLVDKNGMINQKIYTNLNNQVIVNFDLPYASKYQNNSIELKCWVHWKDDIYDCFELHPDGDKSQGAEGLNVSIPVSFEKNLSIWWGIPLSDTLFKWGVKYFKLKDQRKIQAYYNNIGIVIMIFFIVMTFLVVFIKIIKKMVIREYNIDDSEIIFT